MLPHSQLLWHASYGLRSSETQPFGVELFLTDGHDVEVLETDVIGQEKGIFFEYSYRTSQQTEHPDDVTALAYTVRRVLSWGDMTLRDRNLSLTSPVGGELEIQQVGRDLVTSTYYASTSISLPVSIFIDTFGLYRNMYRALLGIYLNQLNLNERTRSRQHNVIPLTLGPSAASFIDVFHTLPGMRDIDAGTFIDELDAFVCAPILFFIGDMPQQQANIGCKGPKANRAYRLCLIEKHERSNMAI